MSESKKEAWKDLDNRKKYLEALSKGRKKPSWRASDIKNLNKSKNIKVSKLSYKFAEILDKLKIKYEMEKEEVWYLVDFSLPDYNLIIEVDGTYWHGDERFYDKFSDQQIKIKKRDIKKNNFLVNHKGYYLIRFLEHDIHNNLDLCISQLDFKIDEIILRRKKIKNAFLTGKLFIESSNKNGIIQKKKIKDVYRHICPHKEIYRITTKNKDKVVITGDHALFNFKNNKINEISAKDATKKIICQQENKLVEIEIKNHKKIESRLYMYDLSVEDNENFCLENGILVHNSMSPPSSEKEIQGFTKIRGHRWPNDILLSHLYNALDWINSTKSPFTNFGLSQVAFRNSQRYVAGIRPLVLMQASIFAMIDLATLWIHEEFDYSMNGISLAINRYDKYSGMASQLQGMIDQQLESYKAGIKYTKGLGQSRYTYGRGASIGPWVSGNGNLKSWIGSFRTGFAPGFR